MELVARLRSLATDNRRKGLAIAVSIVLVVLIGFELARLVWLVVEGPTLSVPSVAPPAAQDPAGASPAREYPPAAASSWKLFGDAAARPQTGTAGAPETDLSLQLLGVFSTPDVRLAGAVIAERGKDGELFRAGSSVPGGATLEKVEKDRVLLRRRGQLETLRFDTTPTSGGSASAPDASRGVDTLGGYKQIRNRLAKPEPGGEAGADTQQVKGQQLIGALTDQLRDDPDGVVTDLGLKPLAGTGGSPAGYQVGEGTSAEVMRNFGLRPGDVILSVNGKPLGNLQSDRALVDEVKASGEARVEIRRGSQTFTVNYPL